MAGTAGSVAPVFRDGGYDDTVIYDFYHALIHNNKLYFCRKDGTIGHEPQEESDEYWFLSLDGNFGDATKLGGESAAQWQTKIDVEKARIDALIALEESSELTDVEKEVNDIKVGADGVTYGTAGTAVRTQIANVNTKMDTEISELKSDLGKMENDIYTEVDKGFVDYISQGTLNSGYVDNTGNTQSNSMWNYYEFNVTENEQYKVHTYYVPVAMGVMLLDSANSIVSMLPSDGQGGIVDIDVTIPTGVTKMIVNYENDVLVPTVQKRTIVKTLVYDFWNPLHGKSFAVLGDSITYGQGVVDDRTKVWGNLIAERNGMDFLNLGISGSTMGNSADGSDTNPCWTNERYKALQGKDYAIIWFGWNDYYFGKLGTVSQEDATTFLGAYYNTLVWLIENSPETKIGVIIPYIWTYDTDPQGFTIMSLINGLKEVCDICGVPYLDINKYNFLQSWGSDTLNDANYYVKWDIKQKLFTSDTLHPNEKGNEFLSTTIENFLRGL